jgi:hypothetical protein
MPLGDYDGMPLAHLAFHLGSQFIIYVVTQLTIWVPVIYLLRQLLAVWSEEVHKVDVFEYLYIAKLMAEVLGTGLNFDNDDIKLSRITSMLERYLANVVFRLNARVYHSLTPKTWHISTFNNMASRIIGLHQVYPGDGFLAMLRI